MRITDRDQRKLLIDKALYATPTGIFNWDGSKMIGILILTLALTIYSCEEHTTTCPTKQNVSKQHSGNKQQNSINKKDETNSHTTKVNTNINSNDNMIKRLPTAEIKLAGQKFIIELAYTQQARDTGLMYRKNLAKNHGMLFIFDTPGYRSFYMKNCLVNLDILFIDVYGRIINTTTMKVPQRGKPLRYYSSFAPAKYALELPAGTIKRLHLTPGINLQLPAQVRFLQAQPD